MTEKDIKKSLSLKSQKGSGGKQSKSSAGSKNVTIQVKRKKIIIPDNPKEKEPIPVTDELPIKPKEKHESIRSDIKKASNIKKPEVAKSDNNQSAKKKTKTDKDDKVEIFENKELHLKEPKPKKVHNNQEKLSDPEISQQHQFEKPTEPIKKEIEIPEAITVSELAQKISVKSSELIKIMMNMGVMATINQSLDQDTAILIIEELGHTATTVNESAEEEMTLQFDENNHQDLEPRAPIVTIMGHVDHGKTSLLDYIRKTKVVSSEAGGITQHIGAYRVSTDKGDITFLDTPGHAAFSAMRARGAQVTDIVILVVSADDGVMPQTEEAIEHAQAAGVPIIVAVNKIDKENADPEKVQTELGKKNVIPEEWGGDTIFIKISALTGEGIDSLLEAVSLQSEILELKASKKGSAIGSVVESSLDKGRGPIATILIQSGTLNKKDYVLVGKEFGRIRAMYNEFNKEISLAGPGCPVVITGLSGTPNVADQLISAKDEKKVKDIASLREAKQKEVEIQSKRKTFSLDTFNLNDTSKKKIINLLIKSDVQGSSEAINSTLRNIKNDDVGLEIVYSGVGGITESDVNLAASSNSIIIGFNVRADSKAKKTIETNSQELFYFSIIYELIDLVKQKLSGLLDPEVKEEIIGIAEVRDVFRSSKLGAIAGSIVSEGVVQKDQPIRVLRDNVVIYEGELESLRRFKEDVKEVKSGTECGIGVKDYNDIKSGDQVEVFRRTEIQRKIQ
ncbi:MAG: translation initiation factor IF-2 [Gammaproteobacteria bacterium]|jgi:translation initiation factor IF-2|nr:translation initiation factor IF-2 [Gammaproteobacteria bacterium]MBT4462965.1 translation initiation factor IF-2 [Gammaproteobacteria bacterium]MBT4654612.1 translation initiation factor IF-2 [Gammaproteobacteria bacterium]MBT5117077.1 translation initiation factor IF-2 [Gammaproteobacteria bacterium]MBT5761298.1 translation initiation factor IF-2 [Gammaproteobacteria bacterium]